MADGAGGGAGLSCHTPRTGVNPLAALYRRGKPLAVKWVRAVFTICSRYGTKQAVRKIAKGGKRIVRVLPATLGCFSSVFSTSFPVPLYTPWGTLGTPVSFALLVRCFASIFSIVVSHRFCSSGRVTQVVHLQGWFPILHTASPCFGHSVNIKVQSAVLLAKLP